MTGKSLNLTCPTGVLDELSFLGLAKSPNQRCDVITRAIGNKKESFFDQKCYFSSKNDGLESNIWSEKLINGTETHEKYLEYFQSQCVGSKSCEMPLEDVVLRDPPAPPVKVEVDPLACDCSCVPLPEGALQKKTIFDFYPDYRPQQDFFTGERIRHESETMTHHGEEAHCFHIEDVQPFCYVGPQCPDPTGISSIDDKTPYKECDSAELTYAKSAECTRTHRKKPKSQSSDGLDPNSEGHQHADWTGVRRVLGEEQAGPEAAAPTTGDSTPSSSAVQNPLPMSSTIFSEACNREIYGRA